MAIVKDVQSLAAAESLANSAAHVAHEAQPYPQDGEVFKGLSKLANALSSAALRCLEDSLIGDPASNEPNPADTSPQV